MNEFEKIKERLENRSNDAEAQMYYLQDKSYLLPCMYNQIDIEEAISKAYCDAKDIVSEVEAEYINKSTEHINKSGDCSTNWIPCEKELPPQPEENPEFDGKPLEVYLVSFKGTKYPWRAFWTGKNFTDGWSIVHPEAWMPLPSPYKPTTD